MLLWIKFRDTDGRWYDMGEDSASYVLACNLPVAVAILIDDGTVAIVRM